MNTTAPFCVHWLAQQRDYEIKILQDYLAEKNGVKPEQNSLTQLSADLRRRPPNEQLEMLDALDFADQYTELDSLE